ncbi:hypothetical protein [Janthinobacterium sp. BJB304]|uniref:hypothetical protein n=1 Tax=Janthinobacterium sp. BJB304 TaxID=1572871 RepID=UPI000C0E8799|nr:hypothetical protein [Janthinobacterium sp. BJB304]PHV36660.1 hypothetical protein CSQ95_22650 [Janthinobacterium sp. BJB304]
MLIFSPQPVTPQAQNQFRTSACGFLLWMMYFMISRLRGSAYGGQDQTDREIAGRHERNGAHAREAELEAKRHISLIMDWLRPSPKKNLT